MKVEVIPYEVEHGIEILKMNGKEINNQLVKIWKEGGPSFTLFIDGQIIFASGVVIVRDWVMGEAWTLTSPLFFKYIKTCYKAVKTYLDRIISDNGLVRVQSLIEVKYEWGDRWMKHLGFEREGILKHYGPNCQDYVIYSRVRQ